MKDSPKSIGLKVKQPGKKGTDRHDPFYGKITIRGKLLIGTVVATNSHRTAKIEFERIRPLKKYERFEKRRTRLLVHNPDSIDAQVGDVVRVGECRPISKTKNFIIIEKLKE